VVLAGFLGVMCCVNVMAVGYMSMMARFMVIAGFVMLGGCLMMLGRFAMMFCCGLGHSDKPPRQRYSPVVTPESRRGAAAAICP
jgi:hypothetical protein